MNHITIQPPLKNNNMSDQQQKPTLKKIVLHRFQIEVLQINLKTFLGSAVSVTFKIGPNEVRLSDWIKIEKGIAVVEGPQSFQLDGEMIYNEQIIQYEPLKAILKIHLKLHQNSETDKAEGLAGVVYLNLADYLNGTQNPATVQLPISNCSDVNAKIEFKIEITDISLQNQSNQSYSEILQQSCGMLPDSIDISSRLEEQQASDSLEADTFLGKNNEINQLKYQLQQLRTKYDQQVKRNSQFAEDESNLIKELKKQKQEVTNCKRHMQKLQKQMKIMATQRKSIQNEEKSNEIARLKKQFQKARQSIIDENQILKINLRESQKTKSEVSQKLTKLKEANQKPQIDKTSQRVTELQGLLKKLQLQNEDLSRRRKEQLNKISLQSVLQQVQKDKCLKCRELQQQYQTKQTLYEEELATLEGILNEAKAETKRMTKKYEHKAMKARHYEARCKEVGDYQQMFSYVLKSLAALLETVGKMAIETIPEEKDLQPYCFQSIFDQMINGMRHFVLSKPQEELKYKEITENVVKLKHTPESQLLKNKDIEVAKLHRQLSKAYSRIEEVQEEYDHIRQSLQKSNERHSLQSPSPRFNEISFSKLPGTEHFEERNYDFTQLVAAIQKLSDQKRILEQQLRLTKAPGSTIERKISKNNSKQSQDNSLMRLDEEFTMEHHKDLEAMRKIIGLKEALCSDLDKNYKQLNEEYRELKSQCEGHKQTIAALRSEMEIWKQYVPAKASKIIRMPNGLATIQQEKEGTLQDEIKELIQSIQKDGKAQPDHQMQEQLKTPRKQSKKEQSKQQSFQWNEIRQEIERKLYGFNLEFIRMQSLRVSKCKTTQETQQAILQFNSIKNRMEQMSQYLQSIGK